MRAATAAVVSAAIVVTCAFTGHAAATTVGPAQAANAAAAQAGSLTSAQGGSVVGAQIVGAQIDEENTGVDLSVDTLAPIVPQPKDVLTLGGTVTNTSSSDITEIAVELQISSEQLTDRLELGRVASDEIELVTRSVVDGTNLLRTRLTPGASAPWTIRVPIANLGLGSSGVYGLRISASNVNNSDESDATQTFLPWFPKSKTLKPTKVVWLWPVTNAPNQTANGVFLNEQTPASLLPGGRLTRLLDIGLSAGLQIEWVVDPQVLNAINGMTTGYQVAGADGELVSGGSPQPAIDWMTKARGGLRQAAVNASAYAFPDVTALTRAKMAQEVVQATTSSTEAVSALLGRPVTTGLGWPAGVRTDSRTLALLQKSGVRTVVLDKAALQPSETGPDTINSAVIRTESGPLAAVLTDRVLSNSLGNASDSPAQAVLARQRFLAETGVLTATRPSENQIVAVGPDPRWDPSPAVISDLLAALRTAPWMTSTSLAQLLADSPKDVPRALAPLTAASRRAALSNNYLERIKSAQERLGVFTSILDEPGQITEKYSTALLRATSGTWRTDRPAGNELMDAIDGDLAAEMNKVRVVSGGVKNFSSETGEVPITIANDLPTPVTVGLTLTGNPPIRLSTEKFTPMTIPANRKISTQITVQVRGNGELPVKVQLTNVDGVAYGEPAEVILRSSAYANAATWVVVIAFVLLALLLLANSIRRRRQASVESGAGAGTGVGPGAGSGSGSGSGVSDE